MSRTAHFRFIPLLIGLGFISSGCEDASWLVVVSTGGFESTGPMIFVHVEQGGTSGYREEDESFIGDELVIRDWVAWEALWSAHRPGSRPPVIDFEREMVLAAFMGRQNLGCDGLGITVQSMVQREDRLEVVIEEARPDGGEDCRANPYDFVRCARSTMPVSFVHTAPSP